MSEKESPTRRSPRGLPQSVLDVGKLVLLVGILVSAGLLSGIVGMRLAVRRSDVSVPALVGLTVEAAQAKAKESALSVSVGGERYHDEIPEGAVVSQFPAEGRLVKEDRQIQVFVSLGPRTHPVPNLIGSPLRVAQLQASQYNYEIGLISRLGLPGVEAGKVVDQNPRPNAAGASSPRINLLVSDEDPTRYLMPNLLGQNVNQAKLFLEKVGFEPARIDYSFSAVARKGTVIRQYPEPGNPVRQTDQISLEVAR